MAHSNASSSTALPRRWAVVCLLVVALGWVLPAHHHERPLATAGAQGLAALVGHFHGNDPAAHEGESHSTHDEDCATCHLSRTLAWASLPAPDLSLGAPLAASVPADPDRLISTDFPAPYYGRAPPASA